MASQGLSSLYGTGWLFGMALLTSLLWYLFWTVLSPVEEDIADIVNWYFFAKLWLRGQYDIYSVLEQVHNWMPLLVITSLILSKASIVYRDYLLKLSQVVYVAVIGYNLALLVVMVHVGWKVIQLFSLTLPLYLLLRFGPLLSYLFSPHTLWFSTSLCLLLSCVCCRHAPSADQRVHRGCGLRDHTATGAARRVIATFSVPLILTLLTVWLMERGCVPCTTTPGFATHTSPPKPTLVAHRGCAFDSPENSMAAYQWAVAIKEVGGLETDVSISMDGVLYLMHDLHLIRTTDVLTKCPSLDPYTNSSMLYFHNGSCPLATLNVAASFVSTHTDVSGEEATLYQEEHIPTFSQFLEMAKKSNKVVIFDVNIPPVGHPYHHTILNRTLDSVLASGLPHNKVWWLPSEGRRWVHANHPNMLLTTKTELTRFEDLKTEHIDKINDDWSTPLETLRRYQWENLTINMFFVDSVFMYDYAWCVGVDSVTTSNCKLLAQPHTNAFFQICKEWESSLAVSRSLLLGGLVVVFVEIIILTVWELMKLSCGR